MRTVNIANLIALIDQLLQKQLNQILHHPRFQQLEASFRGLYYLVQQLPKNNQPAIKIKILNISWLEMAKDLHRAMEFDQSQLFIKIYSDEFGRAGGEPFGLLLGDYEHDNSANTLSTLGILTKIAAAAFAPLITALAPSFFGLAHFNKLERNLNLTYILQQATYYAWKALRRDEDARFLGLMLPKVLWRLPWRQQRAIRLSLSFNETIEHSDHYLWGSPVWCLAAAVMHTFAQTGWFSAICDSKMVGSRMMAVQPLLTTDKSFLAQITPLDIAITDRLEKILSDQGLIALCSKKPAQVALYSCMSVQKPKQYAQTNGNDNSKLASMLNYMLCVCRFAHYLKMIARNKIGAFFSAQACEKMLQDWIHQYVVASHDLSESLKIKYPLRNAKVCVMEKPGDASSYICTIHISPHHQFDSIEADLRLVTELPYA